MKFAPVTTRASQWASGDQTPVPIVRISAGKSSLAISYSDLPRLISELAQLAYDHPATEEATGE